MKLKKSRWRSEILSWTTDAHLRLCIIERPLLRTPEDATEVASLADVEEVMAVAVLRVGAVGTTATFWSQTARLFRHMVQIDAFQGQRWKHLKQIGFIEWKKSHERDYPACERESRKICMLCFVLINSVISNLSCVWILLNESMIM